MAQAEQLSLSWDAHQKSICSGLSALQQRGEFVDMTLAADGHHVKVHQMVLSLVSPYIKELILSAQCPHPVIFLNNISYSTLCVLLEYIYSGEVVVAQNKLPELLAAGKALHIRGLREMEEDPSKNPIIILESDTSTPKPKNMTEKLRIHRERKSAPIKQEIANPVPLCKIYVDETNSNNVEDVSMDTHDESNEDWGTNSDTLQTSKHSNDDKSTIITPDDTRKVLLNQKLQYTMSNQGGLQVICNRFIYHLRYCSKKNRNRLWRCVDYSSNLKCPASIFTDEDNKVTQRAFTHNHPYHDKKIVKKLNDGIIYSMFKEAENLADDKKKQRRVQCSTDNDKITEKSDDE